MIKSENEINKIWKVSSYVIAPYDPDSRRMTKIGFLQAILKLGVKIKEK